MNYREMIDSALKGRSVNSMAKAWGLPQPTLDRYIKGERMPDYNTGLKIAKEAGIDPAEAFEVFAAEERNHKVKNFKLQMGFVQTDLLLFIATCGLSGLVYIM
jgi:transcriptional regulator with XRE-family HTH domain